MRIRDWSSDVCSSDLSARPARTGARARGPGGGAGGCVAGARIDGAGRRAGRNREGGVRRGSAFADPAGRDRSLRPAADHGDRSEEHTSELQSLMRTSYAVFCLKNKTETTIQKQNNTT